MRCARATADRWPRRVARALRLAWRLWLVALLGVLAALSMASPAMAEVECVSAPNPIVCENALPGDPESDWQVEGVGDPSIQGYATSMSVNAGQTEYFKIDTRASSYHIDILRLGYYGGDGARLIASGIRPTAALPQSQPACLKDSSTGLINCGNWGVSASWTVPSDAVSGVYIAHLVRDDTGGSSQIIFVVRNDASHSKILLQTSDATWEAYNHYGGNSLYACTVACPPGEPETYKGAYAVSYNRPFDGAAFDNGASYLYYAEYQMIRFLEKNGYDVSYTSEAEVDQNGALLKNHKVFMSSGHDEYWSGGQRASVEAARDAGVNLAFFSGNEVFWKTRWGPSTEGSNTPYRTLTSYKETHFNAPVDPQDPPTWTGTWRDPRFSPPADGGQPENALTGQQFEVNSGTRETTVPSRYSKLRLWRNTAVGSLEPGQTLTLAPGVGTLGYEWDEDVDNGFRPASEFDLSSTTASGVEVFTDYGSHVEANATATHHLTLYRAPSGALVFGAGTVQWAWGLDNTNAWGEGSTDPGQPPPDPNMQQATVNLLADMGAQPGSLDLELQPATQSTDMTPPTSTITSPTQGDTLQDGSQVTISGTASDAGGGVVAGVEVSTDNGSTWHPATLTTPVEQSVSWSYTWVAHGNPTTRIKSRAVDDSANLEASSAGVLVNVSCPCSIWGTAVTPPTPDSGDSSSVELGVKFTTEAFGTVTGIRFYKSAANTGTHIGSLWSASGERLATATFTNETTSGWQQVNFSTPVYVLPNTTYVASYFDPSGHYAASPDYFYSPPATGGNALNSPPLHALPASASSANGVFSYHATSTFPTSTYEGTNYWVDVAFEPVPAVPGQVTNVSATAGKESASLTWSAPAGGGPVTSYTITPYIGSEEQPATTLTGSPPTTSATVTGLTVGTSYTFTVQASNPNGPGAPSDHSNAVTPTATAAPSAPTGVTASAATSQALVSWSAPASDGGSPLTSYTVTPYVGASAQTPVEVGPSATSTIVKGLTNGTSYTFTVTAANEIGNSPPSGASGAVTPQDTIFDFATPEAETHDETQSVELGVKFSSEVAGTVTGIRFYKSAANTGTHIGSLWSASGTLLASATFTNESASGWQQVNFSTPVAIEANITYVAAYLAPSGEYSFSHKAFATSGVSNPPLSALANTTSANGVYSYSPVSTFPSSTYEGTNYWVDVDFAPNPPLCSAAPSITEQPASQTVTAPAAASFTVTEGAVPSGCSAATIQWRVSTDHGMTWSPVSGSNVSGATSPTLSINPTSTSESGNEYDAMLTNAFDSTESNAATLTVNPPLCSAAPSITEQPASQTVTAPAAASFTVTEGAVPSGCSAATIQWRVSTDHGMTWSPVSGSNVSGATSPTLSINPTSTSESGNEYDAMLTNAFDSTESNAATLTVNPPLCSAAPSITEQPASQTVTAPNSATFKAAGSTPANCAAPTVQWYSEAPGGSSFSPISGATSGSYTTPATTTAESGTKYEAMLTNAFGSTESNAATLTVNPPLCSAAPSIEKQPTSKTVTAPNSATFKAAGSRPANCAAPTVQWFSEAPGGSSFSPISGATSASYKTPATTTAESGTNYQAVFTNSFGSKTTNPATLTVNPSLCSAAPSITEQPASQTVTAPNTATFNAAGSTPANCAAPTVQWYSEAPGGSSFSPISGATSATYKTPATTTAESGTKYEAVLTNAFGSTQSNVATLTVNPPSCFAAPSITEQPASQTVTAPNSATFKAAGSTPANCAAPTVQWYSEAHGASSFSPISGATSATYTTPATTTAESGTKYKAVFTNSFGSKATNAATLTVNPPPCSAAPSIEKQPTSKTVTAPNSATFKAAGSRPANCAAPTVQWFSEAPGGSSFSPISGATSASYKTPATTTAESGTNYEAVFTNSFGSKTTNPATLTVNPRAGTATVSLISPNLASAGSIILGFGTSFRQ